MMKQYNILQAIFMSFYSRNLYRDVANNWGGKAFLYLFLILALSWTGFVYLMQQAINQGYAKNADEIVNQVPVLTIKDGVISTPENHPYIITDPESKNKIAVIDTTGQYKTLDDAKTSILILQKEVITQSKPNEIRTDKIPSTLNIVIYPQTVNSYVKHYLGYAWIFFFVFFLIGSYIFRLIQACFYALIGLIFKAIFRVDITYGQIVIIAMVAITPVIVINTILDLIDITIPHQLLINFVLAMLYLCLGIVANKKQS